MPKKWTYQFSQNQTDGNKDLKPLLGGKGANLAEMSSLGLNVPAGFTLTTEACLDYQKNSCIIDEVKEQVQTSLHSIEELMGKKFGDKKSPLLVSVRSGAQASMPGMMDTVLNLGLNEEVTEGLAILTENERFAWDSYRRFIQMYSNVVMGINSSLLECVIEDLKESSNYSSDVDLTTDDLKHLCSLFKKIILENSGFSFPENPIDQLWKAIEAVFKSWNNPRAIKYRELNEIPHEWGTAVNIQAMVFGNMGNDSATGVCFTRDPSSGDKKFFGEYLLNAQGEDVVAGIRTPHPINNDSKNDATMEEQTLEEAMPETYQELVEVYQKLESHYRDMQDIEFTVERGRLYLLQTRNANRTAGAALKVAVDMVSEGLISREDAINRISADMINNLLHPKINPEEEKEFLAKGLPASPGAGSGIIAFTSEEAVNLKEAGKSAILVRQETSPEDIAGMAAANGILTCRGGMTSHAAVVARGMGKPCVAGCSSLLINMSRRIIHVGDKKITEGSFITIDGTTGEVFNGEVPTIDAQLTDDFETLMKWADEKRDLKVRANADNPKDTATSLSFGAEGIGLCRTEHMFFDKERILAVREMIFANNLSEREEALAKILPFQKEDFEGIFSELNGLPCNIRLLDPPLHEFLPHSMSDRQQLADSLQKDIEEINQRDQFLKEFNPMLGHRGCRLGITYPEIYRVQTRAIIEAAMSCHKKGIKVLPEIMIPLTSTAEEFRIIKEDILSEIDLIKSELNGEMISFKIGTMIELPRAALVADQIAEDSDFFSFGTNDLTQTTYGISRDDGGKFLPEYLDKGILSKDPFVSIDEDGVGQLVKLATEKGRLKNDKMSIGICGEHGGDPDSIQFCHDIGLDYVSCSPFRVPTARLVAAQVSIKNGK